MRIKGLISKPSPGHGRAGTDRQYFYVNGRPVSLPKASVLSPSMLCKQLTIGLVPKEIQRDIPLIQYESKSCHSGQYSSSYWFVNHSLSFEV
jgi:hypothetical protein